VADHRAHHVASRFTSTAANGQHAPDLMLSQGLAAITTPTDLTSLSAAVGMEPAHAKASVGAETPSPKTVEAFALTGDDFNEEQQSQSAHDRDLVDRILTRYGPAGKSRCAPADTSRLQALHILLYSLGASNCADALLDADLLPVSGRAADSCACPWCHAVT